MSACACQTPQFPPCCWTTLLQALQQSVWTSVQLSVSKSQTPEMRFVQKYICQEEAGSVSIYYAASGISAPKCHNSVCVEIAFKSCVWILCIFGYEALHIESCLQGHRKQTLVMACLILLKLPRRGLQVSCRIQRSLLVRCKSTHAHAFAERSGYACCDAH